MTCREPDLTKQGTILLPPAQAQGQGRTAKIAYPPDVYVATAERIMITDPQLRTSWGDRIWRITLTAGQAPVRGDPVLTIGVRE